MLETGEVHAVVGMLDVQDICSAAPRAQARAGPLFAMIDLNAARPSEAPTTAGALFIIGPPRAAAAALYDRERISTSVHNNYFATTNNPNNVEGKNARGSSL